MKKKLLVIGTCIILGVALIFTTAFASKSTNEGYETYKAALKNVAGMESFTGDIQATVTDNGQLIAEVNSKVKANHKSGAGLMSSSTQIRTNKDERTMESYVQDGKVISKSSASDTYIVFENKNKSFDRHVEEHANPEAVKDAEKVLDAMVGNLQNYVMVNGKSDGSSTVTMQLNDNQIPAVVNALTSMGIKGAAFEGDKIHQGFRHGNVPEGFGPDMDIDMPKLVEDIKIDSVNLIADISKDNRLEKQTINVVVSGKDKDGKAHLIEIQFIMNMTDINSTTPDTIDLAGKNVKIIEPKDNEYNR